ncbi:MAG TPA: hypothetical protein VMB35_04615, partial [Methanomicrobiales archaeon]|nr:hypothetical protein [Methanomicrobiales archaeon]
MGRDYKRVVWLWSPIYRKFTTENDGAEGVPGGKGPSGYMKSARAFCCSPSTPKVDSMAFA